MKLMDLVILVLVIAVVIRIYESPPAKSLFQRPVSDRRTKTF